MESNSDVDPADAAKETSSSNQDVAAVREYLASKRYSQTQTAAARAERPNRDWGFRASWLEPGLPSLLAGPIGLACIVVCFGMILPIGIEAMQEVMVVRPGYVSMMLVLQTLALPPIISFGFAAVTPMFWYGGVALRFALAFLSTLPGCLGFILVVAVLENAGPDDFWIGFAVVMFTALLASAGVAVAVQFWSRWTMSHHRADDEPISVPGIRSMIELTAIAAVGYTILITLDTAEFLLGILFFGAMGIITSIAVISSLIVYFRTVQGRQSRTMAALAGFVFAFSAAMLLNGFFAIQEFGWDVLTLELVTIAAVSMYGAFINLGVIWLCLRWLRFCGWNCVDRKARLEIDPAR